MIFVWCWSCLVLLLLHIYGAICIVSQINVTISPYGDIFALKGQPLSLACTINSKKASLVSVYSLSIALNYACNNTALTQYLSYDTDKNSVTLNIPKASLRDDRTYFCCYDGHMETFKTVYVGEKPDPPKRIYCVSLNWLQMSCYLELSDKDTNIPTNWTMEYRHSRQEESWVVLLQSECNHTAVACELWKNGDTFNRFGVYDIRVRVKNGLAEAVSYLGAVSPFDIVKPAPVSFLTVKKTERSSVVMVTWKFPAKLPPLFNMTYTISLKTEEGWDDRSLVINNLRTMENRRHVYEYILEQLIPSVRYRVSVSAKPVKAIGEWYWSEPAVVTMTTNSDVPANSTSLMSGSYSVVDRGEKTISPVLYWKNPAARFSNGIISGYQIRVAEVDSLGYKAALSTQGSVSHRELLWDVEPLQFDGIHVKDTESVVSLSGRRVFTALHEKLLKTKDYLIEMRVGTEKGLSEATSKLFLPARIKAESLIPHRVIVEIDEGEQSALVSWQLASEQCKEELQPTVYWCSVDEGQGNNSYVSCKDAYDWQIVPTDEGCNTTSQNISLPAHKLASDLKFGVSVSMNGISGGTLWEHCRFDALYQAPDLPLYRVDAVPANLEKLLVTILYENCFSPRGGKPTTYQVVCEKFAGNPEDYTCHEDSDVLSFPADFDNPVMSLTNLKAGTQYIVCLRAVNDYHKGEFGKPQLVKTSSPQAVDTKWIWITILGIVLGVIPLAVTSLFCIRYFRRKCKPIEIEDIPDYYKESYKPTIPTYDNEGDEESDSGRGTGSSANSDNGVALNTFNEKMDECEIPTLADQVQGNLNSSATPLLNEEASNGNRSNLPGYERMIPFSNDVIYEEYETDSLIENDEFQVGGDNSSIVESDTVDNLRRFNHVYLEIDDPGKNTQTDLRNVADVNIDCSEKKTASDKTLRLRVDGNEYVDEDGMPRAVISNSTQSYMPDRDCVDRDDPKLVQSDKNKQRNIGSDLDDYVDRDNAPKLALPFKIQQRDLGVNDYVGRADAPKPALFDKKQQRELNTNEYVDNGNASNVGMIDNLGQKTENENHNTCKKMTVKEQNSKNNLKAHESLMAQDYVEEEAMQELSKQKKNGQPLQSVKALESQYLDSPSTLVNMIQGNTDTEYQSDSEPASVAMDRILEDDSQEDHFHPSFAFGDVELTDILESVVEDNTSLSFVPREDGYVDADQISMGSFRSTASSTQDNHLLERQCDTASPANGSLEYKNYDSLDDKTANAETSQHNTDASKIIYDSFDDKDVSQLPILSDTKYSDLEMNKPREIIETTSKSGEISSGSGEISSYVTAGKFKPAENSISKHLDSSNDEVSNSTCHICAGLCTCVDNKSVCNSMTESGIKNCSVYVDEVGPCLNLMKDENGAEIGVSTDSQTEITHL